MSAVGSSGLQGSEIEILTKKLMCSPDLNRDFTWSEIDGVRRVVKIEFTSALLDAEYGSAVKLTRDFNYEVADPFDLDEVVDTLTVV